MNTFLRRTFFGLLATTAMSGAIATGAYAQMVGGGAETDAAALKKHAKTTSDINDRLTEVEKALIDILTKQTAHLSEDQRNSTAAAAKLATSQDKRARQVEIEKVKVKKIQDNQTPASTCSILTDIKRNGVFANSSAADEYFDMKGAVADMAVISAGIAKKGQEQPITTKGEKVASDVFVASMTATMNASGLDIPMPADAPTPSVVFDEARADAPINIASSVLDPRAVPTLEKHPRFDTPEYDETYQSRCEMYTATAGGVISSNSLDRVNFSGARVRIEDELGDVARSSLYHSVMQSYCNRNKPIGVEQKSFTDQFNDNAGKWRWEMNEERTGMDNSVQVQKEILNAVGQVSANDMHFAALDEERNLTLATTMVTQQLILKELRRIGDTLAEINGDFSK